MQDMNDLKTTISSEANSYWSHRKPLLTAAEAQKCLSADQLSAIREPAYQLAKGVNFDQLPDEASEGTVRKTTPRMPSQAPSKYLSK